MKLTILLFILTAFVLFYSYQYAPNTPRERQTVPQDTSSSFMVIDTTEEAIPFWEEEDNALVLDSLYLQRALEQGVEMASPSFGAASYNNTFTYQASDSTEEVYVEMLVGQLLQDEQQYFLLRRFYSGTDNAHLDLYKIQADTLSQLVLSHVQEDMTYMKDTFFDINGDQQLDFAVHWYPSAGSWHRDVYTIYLRTMQNSTFTKSYTFMNPHFFPTEGIVRGKEYGDPSTEPFYKYQWQGTTLDTVEYVYPHLTQKGKYIRLPKEGYLENLDEGILVDSLPEEYKGIW